MHVHRASQQAPAVRLSNRRPSLSFVLQKTHSALALQGGRLFLLAIGGQNHTVPPDAVSVGPAQRDESGKSPKWLSCLIHAVSTWRARVLGALRGPARF